MKIEPSKIKNLITQIRTSYKAVLIHGTDFSVVEDCAQQIIHIIQPQKDDFSLVKLTRSQLKEQPGLLLDEGNTISFLGTRKLIWLKDADNTVTNAVETYLTNIKTDTFLLLTADSLPKSSSLRLITESSPNTLAINCYTDEQKITQTLINSYLKEKGYNLDQSTLYLLLERLDQNRLTIKSELEKLITYMGNNKQINQHDVENIIPDTITTSFDMLCHAIGTGNLKIANKAYHILLSIGETPVGITRIIMSYFNKILLGIEMFEKQKSQDEIFKKILKSYQFKQKDTLQKQVSIFKKPFIIGVLKNLLETEKQIKTIELSPELILEETILKTTKEIQKMGFKNKFPLSFN